jgi:hypothetical protein
MANLRGMMRDAGALSDDSDGDFMIESPSLASTPGSSRIGSRTTGRAKSSRSAADSAQFHDDGDKASARKAHASSCMVASKACPPWAKDPR